jgi:hypothetical protein
MAALLAEKQWPKEIVFFQREMFLRLLQEAPVKTPACAMRRSALEDIGYFNDVWHSGSDWNFFLRFSKHNRFGYVDEPPHPARCYAWPPRRHGKAQCFWGCCGRNSEIPTTLRLARRRSWDTGAPCDNYPGNTRDMVKNCKHHERLLKASLQLGKEVCSPDRHTY